MAPLALFTGASTGIGRACAIHLRALGYEVLAGVRNESAAKPASRRRWPGCCRTAPSMR